MHRLRRYSCWLGIDIVDKRSDHLARIRRLLQIVAYPRANRGRSPFEVGMVSRKRVVPRSHRATRPSSRRSCVWRIAAAL